ncbi:MAG: SAM-dependent methyltransferase [Phycisphaerales bacterium]|nr:SAM-dependent methyltransferase [Phycisphaerales bacterium]
MTALAEILNRIAASAVPPEETIHALAASDPHFESWIPLVSSRLVPGEDVQARQAAGAFYTPPQLVRFLVQQTLEPWMDLNKGLLPEILDPSCGTGRFLIEAGERLVATLPGDPETGWQKIGPMLHGYDTDSLAIAWLRGRIAALAGGDANAAVNIRLTDALDNDALPSASVDIVLGNPPFGTPLKSQSAESTRKRAACHTDVRLPPYADQASIFLLLSAHALRENGRLGMVQPLSFLAARDTQTIRSAILESTQLDYVWSTDAFIFDAQVHACAIGLRRDGEPAPIQRFRSIPPRACTPCQNYLNEGWAILAAPAFDIPDLPEHSSHLKLGQIADATADFRDQYYGLKNALEECPGEIPLQAAPVVTTGLIDPACCYWSRRSAQLLKKRWHKPIVQLDRLDEAMRNWAKMRLVPKILLPTQTRVLEPCLDLNGHWLPSVPLITVTTQDIDILPRIASLLASPFAALIAIQRHLGLARNPDAIKLAARDVLDLPIPADEQQWIKAGQCFIEAQDAATSTDRDHALEQSASYVHSAFKIDDAISQDLIAWWRQRLPRSSLND